MLNDYNFLRSLIYKSDKKQMKDIFNATNDEEYKNFVANCYYSGFLYFSCSPLYKDDMKRRGFKWDIYMRAWRILYFHYDYKSVTLFDDIKYHDLMQIPTVEPLNAQEIINKNQRREAKEAKYFNNL
jgi:hypothetical protein